MDTLVSQLHSLTPGELPLEVFNEVARLVVTPVIELIIYRITDDGGKEVLLSQRPEDDSFWPGNYHIPGMIITAKNIDRQPEVLARELLTRYTETDTCDVTFVANIPTPVERGPELAIIFISNVTGQTLPDKHFYSLENLPSPLIKSHAHIIDIALKS